MITMDRYLTPEEIAEMLQYHIETVKRFLREGKIPGYKIEGTWRIDPAEFQRFMENRHNQRNKK